MSQRLTAVCNLRCCSGLWEIANPGLSASEGMETVHFYALVRNTARGHPFGTNALRISRSFAFILTAFS
jgi:hypothetical protein